MATESDTDITVEISLSDLGVQSLPATTRFLVGVFGVTAFLGPKQYQYKNGADKALTGVWKYMTYARELAKVIFWLLFGLLLSSFITVSVFAESSTVAAAISISIMFGAYILALRQLYVELLPQARRAYRVNKFTHQYAAAEIVSELQDSESLTVKDSKQ